MLIKLLKYELKATARTMLPLLLIVLATSLSGRLSVAVLLESDNEYMQMLGGLLLMLFYVAILAVTIGSMVIMVLRFRNNLLHDEGYVMLTLPASIHQHIWSKLLIACFWTTVATFAVLAGVIIVATGQKIPDVPVAFPSPNFSMDALLADPEFVQAMEMVGAILVDSLFLGIVGTVTGYLTFYVSMAIGHSFANHKVAWSVGMYFAISYGVSIVASLITTTVTMVMVAAMQGAMVEALDPATFVHLYMWLNFGVQAVFGIAFYFLTVYFMKKRLNLE